MQVDFDGGFEDSKVIAIDFSKEIDLQLFRKAGSEKFHIGGIELLRNSNYRPYWKNNFTNQVLKAQN